jgi:hypothetical protein
MLSGCWTFLIYCSRTVVRDPAVTAWTARYDRGCKVVPGGQLLPAESKLLSEEIVREVERSR